MGMAKPLAAGNLCYVAFQDAPGSWTVRQARVMAVLEPSERIGDIKVKEGDRAYLVNHADVFRNKIKCAIQCGQRNQQGYKKVSAPKS